MKAVRLDGYPPSLQANATTADRVIAYLTDAIRQSRLPAGAVLPSESQTARELKISRAVVREAYRALSATGLLESRNGCAPRVGVVTGRPLFLMVQHALSTDFVSAPRIAELLAPLETQAAALAARNRTVRDIAQLRRAVAAMRVNARDHRRRASAATRFLGVVLQAAGNPILSVVITGLRQAVRVFERPVQPQRPSARRVRQLIRAHALLADAIEEGHVSEAARLMGFRDERRASGGRDSGAGST